MGLPDQDGDTVCVSQAYGLMNPMIKLSTPSVAFSVEFRAHGSIKKK